MNRRPFLVRLRGGERGAVGTIIAVLLFGGVVTGMLALTVDVGNAWWERRQLQNGADATAIALANACSKGSSACSDDPAQNGLQPLAGANAADGLAKLGSGQVCFRGSGRFPMTGLPPCTDRGSYAQLANCTPVPDWVDSGGYPYVETRPSTLGRGGSTILPKFFSQALIGGSGSDVNVSACARAAWGPAGNTGATLPIAIGACEWANLTQVGGVPGKRYAPSPPYTDSPPGNSSTPLPAAISAGSYAVGIFAHDDGDNKCTGSPGQAYPGGFGWMTADSGCVANIPETGVVPGDTGASAPNNCKGAQDLQKYVGTEVFIPIYVAVSGTGSGGQFTISGVASFFLAGFQNVSAATPNKSYAVYQEPAGVCTVKCNSSVTYFWGWFTSGEKPIGSSLGTVDRGATQVVPAG